jgi:hypothetical protein
MDKNQVNTQKRKWKRGPYKSSNQMRLDLMQAYRDVYNDCWTQREAWEKTIHHPAPRVYVSPKQAYEVLRPMFFQGDMSCLETMKPSRQRLYKYLYDTVCELAQKPQFVGKSLHYIVKYAVAQPAPEFFVDWWLVQKVFIWAKKGLIK